MRIKFGIELDIQFDSEVKNDINRVLKFSKGFELGMTYI